MSNDLERYRCRRCSALLFEAEPGGTGAVRVRCPNRRCALTQRVALGLDLARCADSRATLRETDRALAR